MTIYIVLYFLLVILFFYNKKYLGFFSLICLFLLGVLRAESVGTDTSHYAIHFELLDIKNISSSFFYNKGEFLYSYLICILKMYNFDFRYFILLNCLLFWTPLVFLLRKNEHLHFVPIVLIYFFGYYFMFFNISRQMIAASFALLAYSYLESNNIKVFSIIIFSASLIHLGGILCFLAIPLKKISANHFILSSILVFTFILPFLINTRLIAEWVIDNFSFFSGFSSHLSDEHSIKSAFSINRLLMNFLFIYILLSNINNKNFHLTLSVIGLCLLNLFPYNGVMTRISTFFLIEQVIFLSYYMRTSVFNKFIVLIYSTAVFISFISSNNGGFLPYECYIDN